MTAAVPAALLLTDSLVFYLRAMRAAQDSSAGDGIPSAAVLPALPPDAARPRAEPTDDARVRAVLAATDPLYFDGLSSEDAARARAALDRAASMVRKKVEARSITNLRATRWGRALAVALVVAYGAIAAIRAAVLPKNVALHKPVIPSSVKFVPSDGQTITDGEVGLTFGVHTEDEASASVTIDLLGNYRISSVKVHNRRDGWWDFCLPLALELSSDGKNYHEIARRDQHFDADPPWEVKVSGEVARYVRVREPHRGELVLSEVEVFGKRM